MIDRLQNYYGIAIRSNKNNLKGMQSTTKAALFHVASNKDQDLNYSHCPVGPDSWCKYDKCRVNGTTIYKPIFPINNHYNSTIQRSNIHCIEI